MVNNYIAQKGERLDSIVNRIFGNLNNFEQILENNPKLQHKLFLEQGDIVNLNLKENKEFLVNIQDTGNETTLDTIEIELKVPIEDDSKEENLKALW